MTNIETWFGHWWKGGSRPACKISKKTFYLVHGYVPKGPRVEATDKTLLKSWGSQNNLWIPGLIFLTSYLDWWHSGRLVDWWTRMGMEPSQLDHHRRLQPRENWRSGETWTCCHRTKLGRSPTMLPILPKHQKLQRRSWLKEFFNFSSNAVTIKNYQHPEDFYIAFDFYLKNE